MGKLFTRLAAAFVAVALIAPAPAIADFAISKPKPKAQKPPQPTRPRAVRQPRPTAINNAAETAVTVVTGIDPALMQEAVASAKYKVTLVRNPQARTALLEATDGKTGWSVNFADCVQDDRCGSMEFYTLWRTPNEANVCTVWGRDVVKDPTRNLGKPFCYTVPTLGRQLHLKLSSEQAPYAGLSRMDPAQAKERMESMIGVWTSSLPMLPQAWTIASSKCPRASDKCG